MRKKLFLFLFLLLAPLLIVGCGKADENKQTSAGEKKLFKVRVATQSIFNEVPIADDLGFFKEEGIEIEYTGILKPGQSEFLSVAQGVNDAFGNHPSGLAQAILGGAKLKAIAPGMVDHKDIPHVNYLVREDSPIKSLDDIVGKKVGITGPNVCNEGYLKLYLKKHNLPDNVEWVTLPQGGQQEQALKQGLIDVATSHPPYIGIALKQGGVRSIGTSYDILQSSAAGLSVRGFSEKFIKDNPEVVKGYARALYRARVWINSHQKEASELFAKRVNLKPEDVSGRMYHPAPAINASDIELWFAMSEELGLWKKGAIKPTDIYTNEFAPKQ
ncbi:ABC transporter substrate-binding protein|uniref:ABC-type nitrate/sulfonate/bicarbonate transport system, substrate-binding protein n=1 Tax=Dendrosporobacter quercicolus TaxID=146817 RepID=A0A1G9NHG4_9FIRM|nr:ABC transporter substrate-binding protein [Dendrosporobacter quercicolus]NSL47344.1 ABC transporter substrate-binding protein [Dendrosporobacter quercicolus DSM 1736]SDL86026.1 ABC-type nitrate/sulfonate/bicarbonate transport system, substrate-binding protein [Dendrosporobacter quercicolus]